MKDRLNSTLVVFIVFSASILQAQPIQSEKVITVTGYSSIMVEPSTYTTMFGIQEFFSETETGSRQLVSIEETKKGLIRLMEELNFRNIEFFLVSVSSYTENNYRPSTTTLLRKTYTFTSDAHSKDQLLSILEKVRLRGLMGVAVQGTYTDGAQIQKKVCDKAILDAERKADNIYEKLGYSKGNVLSIYVNDRGFDAFDYREIYQHNIFGNYTFNSHPKKVSCQVTTKFEIIPK